MLHEDSFRGGCFRVVLLLVLGIPVLAIYDSNPKLGKILGIILLVLVVLFTFWSQFTRGYTIRKWDGPNLGDAYDVRVRGIEAILRDIVPVVVIVGLIFLFAWLFPRC